MALWEFVLTETDNGKGDHKHYKDRRILALVKAGLSGVTVQQVPTDQGPDSTGHGVYYWLVDDPSGGANVQALCCYFNTQTYVLTARGYPRPKGGPNQDLDCDNAQIKEGVERLNDIFKSLGLP